MKRPKFKIGDKVWAIHLRTVNNRVLCVACEGRGAIVIQANKFSCNSCFSRGFFWGNSTERWALHDDHPLSIGKRSVEETLIEGKIETKVTYMCVETGVGTGTVYYEDRLYPSKESALIKAEELNNAKTNH